MRRRLLLCAIVLIAIVQSGASDVPRVRIYSPGVFANAPADWWVRVQVDPRAENRWVEVVADGNPGMYLSERRELAGEQAPFTVFHQLWFKGLTTGCYVLSARVGAGERVFGQAVAPLLHVLGPDGDPCP